jgi:hypothetical protein
MTTREQLVDDIAKTITDDLTRPLRESIAKYETARASFDASRAKLDATRESVEKGALMDALEANKAQLESAPDEIKAAVNAVYAWLESVEAHAPTSKAVERGEYERLRIGLEQDRKDTAELKLIAKLVEAKATKLERKLVKSQQVDGQEDHRRRPAADMGIGELLFANANRH